MVKTAIEHLTYMVSEFGTRAMGSLGNHRAAHYIEGVFRQAGLEPLRQRFDCPAWNVQDAYIELVNTRVDVTANAFTQPCDVYAESVCVCTLEELRHADISGKIVILYGDIVKERFFPRAFTMFQPEHHVATLRLLEEKRPEAIITVSKTMNARLSLITDWQFSIPSVTVTPEDALKLLVHQGAMTLKVISETAPGHSSNILARKLNESGARRVVICAHYDTHFESIGANDNGAGVAVMLELAQRLCPKDLHVSLEFIAFSGEEYAALGDQAYLSSQPDLSNIIAVINIDGVGQALGNNTMTTMGTSEAVDSRLRQVKTNFPGVLWVDPWYESNHTTFVFQGVPAIPLASLGVDKLIDGPQDQLKWIGRERLDEAVRLAEAIVYQLNGV